MEIECKVFRRHAADESTLRSANTPKRASQTKKSRLGLEAGRDSLTILGRSFGDLLDALRREGWRLYRDRLRPWPSRLFGARSGLSESAQQV